MSNISYSISQISQIIAAKTALIHSDNEIRFLISDSRSLIDPVHSLFFALLAQRDGHHFLASAYANGVRNFVISKEVDVSAFPESNFIWVDNTLAALQNLAAHHRNQFQLPVIGVTGSNGKTIVKEWLYQLLNSDYRICRSPKSFNSQIGVPLSVWQLQEDDSLAIFEAGISRPGEMDLLAAIIKPSIGILTNIGPAHAEGFYSLKEKLSEKLKLFKGVELLIYSPDYTGSLEYPSKQFTWSKIGTADLQIISQQTASNSTKLIALFQNQQLEVTIPYSDDASIENSIICWAALLAMGYQAEVVANRLSRLSPVSMRLVLLNGIDNCSIIDDSYSADPASLAIALDFLKQQNQHPKRTLILSDLLQTGKPDDQLYAEIALLISQKGVDRFIGIGEKIKIIASQLNIETQFFADTAAFLQALPILKFQHESILVKGARPFGLEKITKALTLKIHDTVLEINLNAISNNLNYYRNKLNSEVKIMVMVKAFSYGSGSFEIANLLQFQKVDYLAVAYADEGIALRKAGISLPIMVMSPEPSALEAMISYRLEPEIYSLEILESFVRFIPQDKIFDIHLKLDTGMHRLGFEEKDLSTLIDRLNSNRQLQVKSIFTHLVAAENPVHDSFTLSQLEHFSRQSAKIVDALPNKPLLHVLNTSGISRWPDAQFNMVRLGIGLYGFDSAMPSNTRNLQTVATLKTTISQVKELPKGETIGYGRRGVLENGGRIATVKIGYADGYDRRFGNGVGRMVVNGQIVPTIGAICMDMCMLDVSSVAVEVGDEVQVFGENLPISQLASQIETIPYEILTNVSQRVKRVYFYE